MSREVGFQPSGISTIAKTDRFIISRCEGYFRPLLIALLLPF